jgi:hypothetical protein
MYPTEMTREQRLCLVNLNNRLPEIHKQLGKEVLEIINAMDKRINDANDWVHDFNINSTVRFYLKHDDPAYSAGDGQVLAELTIGISFLINPDGSLLASPDNWNDCGIPDMENPDQLEHHCWFYHQLYDHTKLSWDHMLRIGDIGMDINLTLQHHQHERR